MDDRGNWHKEPTELGSEATAALQAAAARLLGDADKTAEPPSKVMLYLDIGEIVEIHGEKFRVRKITAKDIILRSVRST